MKIQISIAFIMLTLTILPSGIDLAHYSKIDLSGSAGNGSIRCKEFNEDLRLISFDCEMLSSTSLLTDILFSEKKELLSIFFLASTDGIRLRNGSSLQPDLYMNAFFLNATGRKNLELLNGHKFSGFVLQFTEGWLKQWLKTRSELSLLDAIGKLEAGMELFPAYTNSFLKVMDHMLRTPELLIGETTLLLGIDDLLGKFAEHLHFTKIRFKEHPVQQALLQLKSDISSFIPKQKEAIERIAGELGLPAGILFLYFQRYFGVSIHRFCIDSKMKAAMKRIGSENLNLNELASELGFECRSTFTKSFTEYFGYTPTEYRRNFKRA